MDDHRLRFGFTQRKLDASFGSPWPLYRGYVGYTQSGRVNNTVPLASVLDASKASG